MHVYSPASSGYTSSTLSVARPHLYVRSTKSLDSIFFPSLYHLTCGSGSPVTEHCNVSRSPSPMLRDLRPTANCGATICESSGGSTNSLVELRDLEFGLTPPYFFLVAFCVVLRFPVLFAELTLLLILLLLSSAAVVVMVVFIPAGGCFTIACFSTYLRSV